MAVDLLQAQIELTRRVLARGKTVMLDADSICMGLERIKAQVERRAQDPGYIPPQLSTERR